MKDLLSAIGFALLAVVCSVILWVIAGSPSVNWGAIATFATAAGRVVVGSTCAFCAVSFGAHAVIDAIEAYVSIRKPRRTDR